MRPKLVDKFALQASLGGVAPELLLVPVVKMQHSVCLGNTRHRHPHIARPPLFFVRLPTTSIWWPQNRIADRDSCYNILSTVLLLPGNMAAQVSTRCPLPHGVRAYVLRGNDMIPLIPADQLPFHLQGIPRQLTHRQMSDENWKLLQETQHPAIPLSIQKPSSISPSRPLPAPTSRFLAPDHCVRTKPANTIEEKHHQPWSVPTQVVDKESVHASISASIPQDCPSSLVDRFASIYPKDAQRIGYRIPYPSGIEPDPSKKVFCSHWIKTGECGYMEQGCRYKHEMPSIDRLREIGFTQVPKWWKEKTAIAARGPTWMQRRLASGNEDDDDELKVGSSLRVFPDPSTFKTRQLEGVDPAQAESSARPIVNVASKKATALHTDPQAPLSPTSESSGRRDSKISDLLIDLRETPVPSPSPQPSDIPSSSAVSSDTHTQSDTIVASSPPTPIVTPEKASTTTLAAPQSSFQRPCKAEELPQLPAVRRSSLVSWASDSEPGTTPVKNVSERKNPPRRSARRSNQPGKQQSGMAKSKHTAVDTNVCNHQARNVEAHSRNAGREMSQRNGNKICNPKIEQSSRGTCHKERTRRNAIGDRTAASAAIKRLDC